MSGLVSRRLSAATRPKGGLPAVHSIVPVNPAGYGRISLDLEGMQKGTGRQHEEVDTSAAEIGWPQPEWIEDPNISAMKVGKRPGFDDIVRRLRTGTNDGLVVNFQDRLVRHHADVGRLLDLFTELAACGVVVPIYSTEEGFIDLYSARGRKQFRDAASAAAYEIERLAERARIKHRQSAHDGKNAGGGPRPFGYLHASCPDLATFRELYTVRPDFPHGIKGLDLSDELFAKVDRERQLYAEAVEHVLAGGSLNGLAATWNARGDVTTEGKAWSHSTVRHKVTSPRQAGLRIFEQETITGDWEALVTGDRWHALQRKLERDPAKRRATGAPYLLAGLVRSTKPGPTPAGGLQHGQRRYLGNGINVIESDLDEIVLDIVFDITDGKAILSPGQAALDRRDLIAEVARLSSELKRRRAMFDADDTLDEEDYDRMTRKVRTALRDAERRLGAVEVSDSDWADLLAEPGALRREWDGLSMRLRRTMLRFLIRAVVVEPSTTRGPASRLKHHRGRVSIEWNEPVR